MIISIYIGLLLGILINLIVLYITYILYNIFMVKLNSNKIIISNSNKLSKYYISLYNKCFTIKFRIYFKLLYIKLFSVFVKTILNIVSKEFNNKFIVFIFISIILQTIIDNINIDWGNFLQNYANLISSDEVFLCSDRTPLIDLWDSQLNMLPPLPNRPPNSPRKDIPSKWGPGKPWGEGSNRPGGPNGPEGPRSHPIDPRSRDNESDRKDFFDTVLNPDNTPQETWEAYIKKEQSLGGSCYGDDITYRSFNVLQPDLDHSIRAARYAHDHVQLGQRPRMHILSESDRMNIGKAFWEKHKNTDAYYGSQYLSYSTHKAMMRGKDYNISIKHVLQSLGKF